MKIITVAHRWTFASGLSDEPDAVGSRWWRAATRRVIFLVMGSYSIVVQMIYIHHYRHDFLDIGPGLYSCCLFLGQFCQFVALLSQRGALNRYVNEVAAFAEQLIAANPAGPAQRVEHSCTKYFTLVFRWSAATATAFIVAPAIVQYQAYASGAVTERTFEAPFHDMYYFVDTRNSPWFEIAYVVFSAACVIIVVMYLAKNFIFFGVCLYMVALYDELKLQLRKLDDSIRIGGDGDSDASARLRQFRQCICMHKQIIGLIVSGNAVFNNVIMIQFVYSLFTLALLVLATTCVELTRMAMYVMNAICLFGELFLFCLTGNLVLVQAEQLNAVVYALHWYEYTAFEKRLFAVVLLRNQRAVGFTAFGYMACDLQTFQIIVSKVFSAFTCLSSMR